MSEKAGIISVVKTKRRSSRVRKSEGRSTWLMALWTLVVVAVLFVGIQVLGKIKAAFGGSVQAAGTANIQASDDTYLREDVAASP